MKNKYYTPNFDKVLTEENYIRFENHPIYFKKQFSNKNYYLIIFDLLYNDYTKLQESYLEKIGKDKFKILTLTTIKNFCHTVSENIDYSLLLMLATDFYSHNNDIKNFNKTKKLYNKISFNDYETGKNKLLSI